MNNAQPPSKAQISIRHNALVSQAHNTESNLSALTAGRDEIKKSIGDLQSAADETRAEANQKAEQLRDQSKILQEVESKFTRLDNELGHLKQARSRMATDDSDQLLTTTVARMASGIRQAFMDLQVVNHPRAVVETEDMQLEENISAAANAVLKTHIKILSQRIFEVKSEHDSCSKRHISIVGNLEMLKIEVDAAKEMAATKAKEHSEIAKTLADSNKQIEMQQTILTKSKEEIKLLANELQARSIQDGTT